MRFAAAVVLSILIAGCGAGSSWQQVDVRPDFRSVRNPIETVKAMMHLHYYTPHVVEVSPDMIKTMMVMQNGIASRILVLSRVSEFRILARDETYQVSAYDHQGDEIWYWRCVEHDYETSKKMYDALYALWNQGQHAGRASQRTAAARF